MIRTFAYTCESRMPKMPDGCLLSRRSLCRGIWGVPFAMAAGCREDKDPQIIDPSDLKKIKIGDVVHLIELLKAPAEKVCLLSPYRDRLSEKEPLGDLVNGHLRARHLRLDEGEFALVFVSGDKVTVQRLGVAAHNMFAWHEGAGRILKPLGCANADRVLVTKVNDAWPALVFGEER